MNLNYIELNFLVSSMVFLGISIIVYVGYELWFKWGKGK